MFSKRDRLLKTLFKPVSSLLLLCTVFLLGTLPQALVPSSADDGQGKPAAKGTDTKESASAYTPAPESAQSQKGKQLFSQHGCVLCHSIGGKGGCLGPPLSGVGGRRSKEFITARITLDQKEIEKFAKLYKAQELMPHPRLPRELSSAVVAYLMTLPQPAGGFKVGGHNAPASESQEPPAAKTESISQTSIIKGKKLFYDRGCTSCHSIHGAGGQFAPALDGVAQRLGRQKILTQISKAELLTLGTSGEYVERGTVMPPSNLSKADIANVTNFLLSLPPSR
jgi:mono/diheme cytochrome c family protein